MTAEGLALVITASATFVTSLGGVLLAWRSMRVSIRNGEKLEEVHRSTNGKMAQLLALTAKASRAQGGAEEKERVAALHESPSDPTQGK
jgi:uncharacterized membrane protein